MSVSHYSLSHLVYDARVDPVEAVAHGGVGPERLCGREELFPRLAGRRLQQREPRNRRGRPHRLLGRRRRRRLRPRRTFFQNPRSGGQADDGVTDRVTGAISRGRGPANGQTQNLHDGADLFNEAVDLIQDKSVYRIKRIHLDKLGISYLV